MRISAAFCILIVFLFSNIAVTAQSPEAVSTGARWQQTAITSTNKQFRVIAENSIREIRLEIFNSQGNLIFDSNFKPGNLLDWNYRDQRGDQLPAGTYLCRVTMKSLNGDTSLQQGTLTLSATEASFLTTSPAPESEVATTLLAHDGEDGRVVSSRGGLRFYSGNVFAGREVELMRITEQGYLGLGIQSPQAKLDVNGMIRTHGIVFPDGSIQTSALNTRLNPIKTQTVSGDGGTTANIGGSGTTGKIPKWTDGASGTLGDSVITESSGNIGIGTASPAAALDVNGSIKSDKLYIGVVPNAVASTDFRGVIGDLGGGGTEYYFTNIFPSYSPTNNVGGTSNNFFGITLDANIYDTTATGNLSGRHTGGRFRALTRTGTRAVSEVVGGQFNVVHLGNGSTFGNITNAYAGLFSTSISGGTITNNYGAYIGNPNGAGSMTNNYGLYLEAQTKAMNNWAIYAAGGQSYFGGNVGIGIATPTTPLQVAGLIHSTTGGIKFPDGTTQTTAATFTSVTTGTTLTGNGTAGTPLNINVPLSLSGNSASAITAITNTGSGNGLSGTSSSGIGVYGTGNYGVQGDSSAGIGVFGQSTTGTAVSGSGPTGVYGVGSVAGVQGFSSTGTGISGNSTASGKEGVYGESNQATGYGVHGKNTGGGKAGYFEGDVQITGSIAKGSGSFKIDHPLDPENKYLYHSFVESPDMKNIYDGVSVFDAKGEAVVTLPDWFQALNRDFRYQLTCIGGYAPVYIAEEIKDNRFKIAGGKSGMKVSWQITGIRQDPYANVNRIPVEQDKSPQERGTYLHPQAYGIVREKREARPQQ